MIETKRYAVNQPASHSPSEPPGGRPGQDDIFTVPNALSFARIVLGVAFPFLPPSWRAAVIVIAAVTDLLDGALSRLLGLGSRTGRFLDPVADKTFVAGVIVTFLYEGLLTWVEFLLVAARDLAVLAGAVAGLALRHWAAFRMMAPSFLGKATTAAQFGFFLALVLEPPFLFEIFQATAILSVAAAAQYLGLFFQARADH